MYIYFNLNRFYRRFFVILSIESSKKIKKIFRLTFSFLKNRYTKNIAKKKIFKSLINKKKLLIFQKFKLLKNEPFVLLRICFLLKNTITFFDFLNLNVFQKYNFEYKQLKIKKFFDIDSLFCNTDKILIGKISDFNGKIFSWQAYIKFKNKEDCLQLYNYFKKNQKIFPVPENAGYLSF